MEHSRSNNIFRVTFRSLGIMTMSLPAFATAFAVIWSLLYDFEGSTKTHCRVYNFLPSISAAIGRTPQRYMWRICIAMHTAPRFMKAIALVGWYKKTLVGKHEMTYLVLAHLAGALHIIENAMLVMLTSISSNENRSIHEGSFVLFIISSWTYMMLTIYLCRWKLKEKSWKAEKEDLKSYKYKKIFAFVNIASFLTAIYLYFRHNWYCEPLVYSYFAFCEYLTIYTNIAFHGTCVLDLRDFSVGVVLTDLLNKHRYKCYFLVDSFKEVGSKNNLWRNGLIWHQNVNQLCKDYHEIASSTLKITKGTNGDFAGSIDSDQQSRL